MTKKVQNDQGDLEDDRFFVLRLYTVFNVDQVEGLDHLRAGQPDTGEPLTIDYQPADEALEAARVAWASAFVMAGDEAFYNPQQDYIQMPPKATFESLNEYYATAFHECVHATEHPSRLDWSRKDREHAYALGELIAELGGVFVCRELGVPASDDLDQPHGLPRHLAPCHEERSSVHLHGIGTSQQRRRTYILSFSRKPEDVPEPDGELVTA